MKTPRKGDDKNWIAFWKSPLEEGSMRRKVLLKDYKSKEAFENKRRINEKIGVSNIEYDDENENVSEIARYYGHFKREKRTYGYAGVHNPIYIYTLVFKYYEAEDLFDYISNNHPSRNQSMDEEGWYDIVKLIFKKMVHLSIELAEKDVTHGDISIENYLIDKEQNLILIDFGNGALGRYLKGSKGFKEMNLPPEFIADARMGRFVDERREFIGEKCDVFGIGVVLYVLFAGLHIYSKLFDEHFNFWYNNGIRHCYYQNILSKAPQEAKELLSNMLEKNPVKRISVEEIFQHKYCVE
jgi:serine/threonine protein kinase